MTERFEPLHITRPDKRRAGGDRENATIVVD